MSSVLVGKVLPIDGSLVCLCLNIDLGGLGGKAWSATGFSATELPILFTSTVALFAAGSFGLRRREAPAAAIISSLPPKLNTLLRLRSRRLLPELLRRTTDGGGQVSWGDVVSMIASAGLCDLRIDFWTLEVFWKLVAGVLLTKPPFFFLVLNVRVSSTSGLMRTGLFSSSS